jgi:hypothetical protein
MLLLLQWHYSPSGALASTISQGFKTILFYRVRLSAPCPTPNLRARVSLFVWVITFDLSGMGNHTSSYATAGIVLRNI